MPLSCHVFPPGFPYQDLSLPISERLRSRPVRGEVLTLEVGDPNDEAGLPPGATRRCKKAKQSCR